MNIMALAEKYYQEMIALRRDFHRNPELSFKENRTTSIIKNTLMQLGIDIVDIGLHTGVIGIMRGNPGPTIALRADIDALPITELNRVEYCSLQNGHMHACGHDLHMAALLGVAMILSDLRSDLDGNILFIFQPAEEINQGAKQIVQLGLFEKIAVDLIIGAHNHPAIPWGKIAVHEGTLMAAVDTLKFKVNGKGGHGGLPQDAQDPIVAAAAMILGLQTIVSRNVSAVEPAVISIGSVQAGDANNVIPEKVSLSGTVRSFGKQTRQLLHKRILDVLKNTALTYQVTVDINYTFDLDPVVNSKELCQLAYKTAQSLGISNCVIAPQPSTGGEDFSVFTTKIPGFFYWFGVGNQEQGIHHPWHSPYFDGDERGMVLSAAFMTQMALHGMNFSGLAHRQEECHEKR